VPGLPPSGGEGRMGSRGVSGPSASESLRQDQRYREFYEARDKRRHDDPDSFSSGFTDGDRETFRGQEVTVEHVEKLRPGVERLYLRGDTTGTFVSDFEKTSHGEAVISNAKRSRE
jgi:hypothetical protein